MEVIPMQGSEILISSFRSRKPSSAEYTPLWNLCEEIRVELSERTKFMEKPVTAEEGIEIDQIVMQAIENLVEGKS